MGNLKKCNELKRLPREFFKIIYLLNNSKITILGFFFVTVVHKSEKYNFKIPFSQNLFGFRDKPLNIFFYLIEADMAMVGIVGQLLRVIAILG